VSFVALLAAASVLTSWAPGAASSAPVPWPSGDECLSTLRQDLGESVALLDGLCLAGWAYVDLCADCEGDGQVIVQYTTEWQISVGFPTTLCRVDALASGTPTLIVDRVNWPCDGGAPEPPPIADEFPLRVGSTGPRVAAIQQRLVDLGFGVGSSGVDGRFGPDTTAAVIGWQQSVQLPNTGELYEPSFQLLTAAPVTALLPTNAGGDVDASVACSVDELAGVGVTATTVNSDLPSDDIVLKFGAAHCSEGWAAVLFQGFAADDLNDGLIGDVSRLYLYDLGAARLVATVDAPYSVSRSVATCLAIPPTAQELFASMLRDDAPATACDTSAFQTVVSSKQLRVFDATGALVPPESLTAASTSPPVAAAPSTGAQAPSPPSQAVTDPDVPVVPLADLTQVPCEMQTTFVLGIDANGSLLFCSGDGEQWPLEFEADVEYFDDERYPLRLGQHGAQVQFVQSLLGSLGYELGPSGADGYFGAATYFSVIEWQFRNGRPVTEVVTVDDMEAMRSQVGLPQ
jgi:peptidoglycan hydrolase-like protein with peptidoglycan-binding domain